jgi:hypothetical protein
MPWWNDVARSSATHAPMSSTDTRNVPETRAARKVRMRTCAAYLRVQGWTAKDPHAVGPPKTEGRPVQKKPGHEDAWAGERHLGTGISTAELAERFGERSGPGLLGSSVSAPSCGATPLRRRPSSRLVQGRRGDIPLDRQVVEVEELPSVAGHRSVSRLRARPAFHGRCP